MQFPWQQPPVQTPLTPRELMLQRLSQGVPVELALRAAGIPWEQVKDDPEVDKALAEGEIMLFERARDSGVTGVVRAAMRYETKTWTPKAEGSPGQTLEDLLRD
jgi:hypothetical protein